MQSHNPLEPMSTVFVNIHTLVLYFVGLLLIHAHIMRFKNKYSNVRVYNKINQIVELMFL